MNEHNYGGWTADEVGKKVAKVLTSVADKTKYNTAYEERTGTSVDELINQARILMDEIEDVAKDKNTPEEKEYIEALEKQLDRYLLAIKYS